MQSLEKNLKTMILVTLAIKIMGFIYKIICAKYLPFDVMETIAIINPILNLALVMSCMSLPILINQRVSKNIACTTYYNRPFISSAIKIIIISSTLILIIFSISTFYLGKYVYHNSYIFIPTLIMMPVLYFSNLSAIMKGYLEAHNNFTRPIFSNLIEQIIKLISIIIIILFIKTFSSYNIIILIGITLTLSEMSSFMFLLKKIKKMTPLNLVPITKDVNKSLIYPGLILTLFSLVLATYHFLEPLIYYYFTSHINISKESTSYIYTSLHGFILPIFQVSSFLTYILIKLLFPQIASKKENKDINYIINKAFYILLLFEGIIFIITFFHSDVLLNIVYKSSDMSNIMKYVSPGIFLTFVSPLITMTFEATSNGKVLLKNGIYSSIISLIVLIITGLIKDIALYSIIISSVLSDILYLLFNLIDYHKIIKEKFLSFKLLLLIPIFICIFFIDKLINNPIKIFIEILLFSIFYFGLFFSNIIKKNTKDISSV